MEQQAVAVNPIRDRPISFFFFFFLKHASPTERPAGSDCKFYGLLLDLSIKSNKILVFFAYMKQHRKQCAYIYFFQGISFGSQVQPEAERRSNSCNVETAVHVSIGSGLD